MADLKDRLRADLTAAVKARDSFRTGVLRMALTAIQNEEVAGESARTLTHDEEEALLGREVRKRKESAEAYDAGQRPELAAKEEAEIAVIEGFLPQQMDEAATTEPPAVARLGIAEGLGAAFIGRAIGILPQCAESIAFVGALGEEVGEPQIGIEADIRHERGQEFAERRDVVELAFALGLWRRGRHARYQGHAVDAVGIDRGHEHL